MVGSTGVDPVLATLTAGTGIGIVNAAGAITISNSIGAYTFEIEDDLGTTETIDDGDKILFSDGNFITPVVSTGGGPTEFLLTSDLSATGTADATKYLRGDNTWALGVPTGAALTATQVGFGDGANLLSGDLNFTWENTFGVLSVMPTGGGLTTAGISSLGTLNLTGGASVVDGTAVDIILDGGGTNRLKIDTDLAAAASTWDLVQIGYYSNFDAGWTWNIMNEMTLNAPYATNATEGQTFNLMVQGMGATGYEPARIGFSQNRVNQTYVYLVGQESSNNAGTGRQEMWYGGASRLASGGAGVFDEPFVPALKQYMQQWTAGTVAFRTPTAGVGEGPIWWGDDGGGGASATGAVNYYQRQQVIQLAGTGTHVLDYDTHAGAVIFAAGGSTIELPQTYTLIGDTYEIFMDPSVASGTVTIRPGTAGGGAFDALVIGTTISVGTAGTYLKGVKVICIGGTSGTQGILWAIIDGTN